jgi:sugar phosphate isomerase/epimerase
MKLGYTTWGMPNLPIDQALQHLAKLGFDGVEIVVVPGWTTEISVLDAAERKRIAGLLSSHGLELTAIEGYADLMEPDPLLRAHNMERLKAAIDLAVEWAQGPQPPPVIILSCGASDDWYTHRMELADHVGAAADYAAARGVTLAMEPHIGHMVDTPYRMAALLDMVESSNLKVNFDISHFNVLGMSIDESVSVLARHAVHVHVKDESGRYPHHDFLIPGEGTFDYVAFLRAMEEEGYTGFVNAEISKMVQRRPDYDPLAAAEQSYKVLASAFKTAGIQRDGRAAPPAAKPEATEEVKETAKEAVKETPRRAAKASAPQAEPVDQAPSAADSSPPAPEPAPATQEESSAEPAAQEPPAT